MVISISIPVFQRFNSVCILYHLKHIFKVYSQICNKYKTNS